MSIEAHVFPLTEGKRASRSADEVISALAQRQHGVVTRAQLLAVGVGGGAIEGRMASGMLQPLHRGVYAVGHRALRREAWWVAAVLAAGPGAALSYRSAAEIWVIRQSARARIEVSVVRHRRSTARLELHVVEMQSDEVIVEDGIRVTCPSRTLFDLASVLTIDQLEHAFNEAEYRRLSSPVSLDALLARYRKRRGTANLKRVLDNHRRTGRRRAAASSSGASCASSTPTAYRARRSTASPKKASSMPSGLSRASSSKSTAGPPTARARRSRTTAPGTGRSSSPAGGWSA